MSPIITPDTTYVPQRNHLVDRKTGLVYPWPVNHADEEPIRTLGRRLTRSGITASGRLTATRHVALVKQPTHPGPVHLTLRGSMIDREPPTQYQMFRGFFRSCDDRTFDYVDAAGDSYHVVIVGFDARRQMAALREDGSYFTYSLEVEVLEATSGPLVGYAV